jgi:hypothetical protein
MQQRTAKMSAALAEVQLLLKTKPGMDLNALAQQREEKMLQVTANMEIFQILQNQIQEIMQQRTAKMSAALAEVQLLLKTKPGMDLNALAQQREEIMLQMTANVEIKFLQEQIQQVSLRFNQKEH